MIEDPEAPHAHHGGTGIKWLDLALALAVVALSVASLITAQHTGHTMERLVAENSRLVRANATPILQFSTSNIVDGQRVQQVSVANVGTGTARVIWFEIAKNGVPMRGPRMMIGYDPKATDSDYILESTVPGTYLPAGEARPVMSWKLPRVAASLVAWTRFDHDRLGLVPTACFCSVLGECWTSHLGADVPQPVAACDARGHTSFGDPAQAGAPAKPVPATRAAPPPPP